MLIDDGLTDRDGWRREPNLFWIDWAALITRFFLDGVSLDMVVMVKRELYEFPRHAIPVAPAGSTMAPTPYIPDAKEGQMEDNSLLPNYSASVVIFPSGRRAEEDADMTT